MASLYECDSCNELFGDTIENDYGNFFQFYHAIAGIRGKRKIPKFKSKTGIYDLEGNFIPDFELFWEPIDKGQNELCLKVISNISIEDQKAQQNAIVFEELIPNCCPIGVFKAIVKMAITAMPFTELHLFSHTIEWLLSSPHTNIYSTKKLLVRYIMIPGFNVVKYPHFVLYRRKKDIWNKPYMIFNLTYGLFSLLIEVPRDNDKNAEDILSVPFPPIPFFTSSEGYWDLSDETLKANCKHSIELQFDSIKDVTENTTMSIKNGKRTVTTKL